MMLAFASAALAECHAHKHGLQCGLTASGLVCFIGLIVAAMAALLLLAATAVGRK